VLVLGFTSIEFIASSAENEVAPEKLLLLVGGPSRFVSIRLHNYRLKATIGELELELIQTQMAQKPMLRAEVGMRVRCADKASAE
jgi:hypothetical protein